MNPTIDDITKAILVAMTKRPQPILGAQLGALIHKELPQGTRLNIKSQFGGLRKMVEQCAQGHVFWVGKSGLDELFSSNLPSAGLSIQQPAWVVFHNPDAQGQVCYERSTQLLRSIVDGEVPDGCNPVKRVSYSDQLHMIEQFIHQKVNDEEKALFTPVAEAGAEKYWSVFKAALTASQLLPTWQKYRFEALRVLAIRRLEDAGVPLELREQVIDQAIKESSQIRSAKWGKKTAVPPVQNFRQEIPQPQGIHALAAQVVAQMSEADIANMSVPLGAVWRALHGQH